MKKQLKQLSLLVCMLGFLVMPYFVFAGTGLGGAKEKLGELSVNFNSVPDSPVTIIGNVIGVALGFVGIILVVLMLYAGFNWMTAAGEADKVQTAQDTIKRAVIGLIITVSAYAIANFVLTEVLKA